MMAGILHCTIETVGDEKDAVDKCCRVGGRLLIWHLSGLPGHMSRIGQGQGLQIWKTKLGEGL